MFFFLLIIQFYVVVCYSGVLVFSFFISMLFSFISDFNLGSFSVSWVYFTM